jgi:hypothetical protein
MSNFEPLINLLVLLTILSVVAERTSNVIKFRKPELRNRKVDPTEERQREGAIQAQTLKIGIVIAIIAKADMFSMLAHLDDPWSTLGWVRVIGVQWFQSPATQNAGAILYTLGGCALTGLALGFGSKFWHDLLSTVFELRTMARRKGSDLIGQAGATVEEAATPGGENDEQ